MTPLEYDVVIVLVLVVFAIAAVACVRAAVLEQRCEDFKRERDEAKESFRMLQQEAVWTPTVEELVAEAEEFFDEVYRTLT